MDGVREYLISVVAACMLSVPAAILVRKGTAQKVVRLVGGILILLVVIRPLMKISMEDIAQELEKICRDYAFDTETVSENAQEKMATYIKEATQAYIEEQANALGALVQAEVRLTAGDLPVPCGVKLTGTVNAEQLAALREMLTSELGIPEEEQEWNLYGGE